MHHFVVISLLLIVLDGKPRLQVDKMTKDITSNEQQSVPLTPLTPGLSGSSSGTSGSSSTTISTSMVSTTSQEPKSWPLLPQWATKSNRSQWGKRLDIREWDGGNINEINNINNINDINSINGSNSNHNEKDENSISEYRLSNGWRGNDLVHSHSSPVRVLEYRLSYNDHVGDNTSSPSQSPSSQSSPTSTSSFATLTGVVHFTKNAESHQGYCHGGSMCSIMDDIIGWTGFCSTGQCLPWTGYTVQVNTKLCKPVKVGMVLKIVCSIIKMERRKVWVKATLLDPNCDDGDNHDNTSLHAEGEGLVILNKVEK
jgi:acyl-coenzyme A thioesterase PaaI-like protein